MSKTILTTLLVVFLFVPRPEGGIGMPSSGEDDPDLRAVERRLHDFLKNRILVFRDPAVQGRNPKFDTAGRLLTEAESDQTAPRTAVYFLDLEIDSEGLRIRGESVRTEILEGRRRYFRSSSRLELVTCTLYFDFPVEELSFPRAVGMLGRVFLTRGELPGDSGRGRAILEVEP